MKCVTMYTETFVGFYFEIERNVILCMAGRLLLLLRAFTTNDKASKYPLRHWFPSSYSRNNLPQRAPKIHKTLQQMKIPFVNKLRRYWGQGMPAIIRCRIFCLPVAIQKYEGQDELYFCVIFCMCVELGLLTLREEHRLSVFESGVLRKYLGLRRTR